MRKQTMFQSIQMFREIVREMDVSEIPVKYIAAAAYVDEHGMESVVMGDELDELLARRGQYEYVTDVNFILDVRAIALDVNEHFTQLLNRIEKRIASGEY